MVRTRVGYAGGRAPAPTYQRMGDHTEAIQIDFDPQQVSYEELLEVFWGDHDPTRRTSGRQYRSVILAHDAAQRRAAERSLAARRRELGREIYTAIEDYRDFTRAEDYHQKYTLRYHQPFLAPLLRLYPDSDAFTDSTAAARLNGYLAGRGDAAQLEAELPLLGVTPAQERALRARVPR